MKGTVLESKNGKAVILTEDGVFRTVFGSYEVGTEIRYGTPVRNRKIISRIAAAAACLLMVLSMGTLSHQNLMVYATVTLQGQTPIQLELNRKDKVIGVKAVDEAGEALVENLLDSGIKGEAFEVALVKAEQMMAENNNAGVVAALPEVQCKSADKIKDLTDVICKKHKEETTKTPTKGETTAGSSASEPTTTSQKDDSSASVDPGKDTKAEESTSSDPSEEMGAQEDAAGQEAETTTTGTTGGETQEPSMDAQEDVTGDVSAASAAVEVIDQEPAAETSAEEPSNVEKKPELNAEEETNTNQ